MQTIDLNEKQKSLGIGQSYAPQTDEYKELVNYANLKLATLGLPPVGDQSENPALRLGKSLIKEYREKVRLLQGHLCPADSRIQGFLERILGEDAPKLPSESFVLDRHGLSRVVSLPRDGDSFSSEIIDKSGPVHFPNEIFLDMVGNFQLFKQMLITL